ncbi:GNAT family N-acetyltransferase [Halomicroarcula sp. F13]|uniref:GNAT family N-acetyltransferase n=1 Tax=Haloarcula rubra TaxID=2487747 RepID=A0AAW4PNV3_9EURY|nr:GNAT family N-acetyltransferase [Halomicroarcula rubra]MBX0323303.1 GNAT family N-acetyltransferase [Halomicroarcula rubra]
MIRPYEAGDAAALWECKQAFELELGTGTGDDEKAHRYREKLDADYRESYLQWVDRCVGEDERTVQVATDDDEVVGYVFVLPESMAHVWDAAVLNELFVAESHRGTDVADDLLEAALRVARDQSLPLDRLVLDVDPSNERARAFYDRWGFEPWGEMVARPL